MLMLMLLVGEYSLRELYIRIIQRFILKFKGYFILIKLKFLYVNLEIFSFLGNLIKR